MNKAAVGRNAKRHRSRNKNATQNRVAFLLCKATSFLINLSYPLMRVPHTPGFPVKLSGFAELHAAFLNHSRTRCNQMSPRTGNPAISPSFGEMWEI